MVRPMGAGAEAREREAVRERDRLDRESRSIRTLVTLGFVETTDREGEGWSVEFGGRRMILAESGDAEHAALPWCLTLWDDAAGGSILGSEWFSCRAEATEWLWAAVGAYEGSMLMFRAREGRAGSVREVERRVLTGLRYRQGARVGAARLQTVLGTMGSLIVLVLMVGVVAQAREIRTLRAEMVVNDAACEATIEHVARAYQRVDSIRMMLMGVSR